MDKGKSKAAKHLRTGLSISRKYHDFVHIPTVIQEDSILYIYNKQLL